MEKVEAKQVARRFAAPLEPSSREGVYLEDLSQKQKPAFDGRLKTN